MSTQFQPLSHIRVDAKTTILKPRQDNTAALTLESPALYAMTELSRVRPVITTAFASITEANRKMIDFGVRLLFVADTRNHLVGLITATDILGEKPVKYMQKVSCNYEEVLVQDIMTPVAEIDALKIQDVELAKVGDIVETLISEARQHSLVINTEGGCHRIIGIFSTSHISRMMNTHIEIEEVATSFADVQSALS